MKRSDIENLNRLLIEFRKFAQTEMGLPPVEVVPIYDVINLTDGLLSRPEL